MAASLLAHPTKFTCAVAPPLNRQSQGYSKTRNIVRMAYSFQTPPKITLQTPLLGMGVFFGLRALDNLVKSGQTLHSNVATIGRRRGNRIAPKAMFERFTEKGIKVVVLSQEEARRLGHNFVGTEHILLGLIGEGTSIAATVLKSMGINLKDARDEVEKMIGRGGGTVHIEIPFTPRAKNVLKLTLEESRQLDFDFVALAGSRTVNIGPEHLLLGFLREGQGVAARVLESLGADPSNIRKQVIRMVASTTLEDYFTEEGKLDPVEGRLQQVERVTKILSRRTKNNRCLIVEPGVGKIAVAEGLAQRIANGDVPETIEGKMVISLVMGLLVAGTKNREEFEERLKKLTDKIRQSTILFIDEVHTLIGAAEGANISKPALDRFERCIGTTTIDEYMKHIEKLQRKFQPVKVPEPSVDEVIQNSIERRENGIVPTFTFERFTERAIKVLMLSQNEARGLGHNAVGTEQILLGLIREGTGVAAKVLKSMGVNLKDARAEVEKITGRGSGTVSTEIPFTPRAKNMLQLALKESRQLGQDYVGAEHLLLGLLRERESVASCVLESLGVEPSIIFKQAMYVTLLHGMWRGHQQID